MRGLSGNSRGIIMMMLATACFTTNDTLIKLAMADVPPFEALMLRGIGATVLGIPLLASMGYLKFIPLMLEPRIQLRNLLELTAAMGFIFGLAHVPIADLTALSQLSPILLLVGATIFFAEKLTGLQIALVVVAFVGAVLVAQPGAASFSPLTLMGLWSAVAVAARDLVARKIRLEVPSIVIALGAGVIEIFGAGIASLLFEHWRMPTLNAVLFAFCSAAFLIAAQWLLIGAYRVASVGAVVPFIYVATVWSLIAGILVFGTLPNGLAFIGMALIMVSGVAGLVIERWPRKIIVSP